MPERPWLLVPLWGITTRFLGAPRRVRCPQPGVVVEHLPWGKGKRAGDFLTVMDQLGTHCRRLLWVGRRGTQATLRRGLAALGPTVVSVPAARSRASTTNFAW